MSRIGRLPIPIPDGVEVTISDNQVDIKGPKGSLGQEISPQVSVEVKDKQILVGRKDDSREAKALHGLTRSLLANMVLGVTEGFTKELEMVGVGYKAETEGGKLKLSVGFSHPVYFEIPPQVEIKVQKNKKIEVSGIDKELVGRIAAQIRKIKKCNPYTGKGIKYIDEVVKRKAGKAAKIGTGFGEQ